MSQNPASMTDRDVTIHDAYHALDDYLVGCADAFDPSTGLDELLKDVTVLHAVTDQTKYTAFVWIPRMVRKVATTLGIGGVAFVITNMLVREIEWSILLSVFISGVILVVQFLVDVDKRLQGCGVRPEPPFRTG